jgi:hypothetical protein
MSEAPAQSRECLRMQFQQFQMILRPQQVAGNLWGAWVAAQAYPIRIDGMYRAQIGLQFERRRYG